MFHPEVTAKWIHRLESTGALAHLPNGKLVDYPIHLCHEYVERLHANWDPKTSSWREKLTPDQERFILNEQYRTRVDWRYWAERYCKIRKAGAKLEPLFPLWESQLHVLDALGRLEKQRVDDHDPDGLLLDILKARQLGVSTMTQAIIGHRVSTHPYTYALIAADIPAQSQYLFSMLGITLDHVPHYFRSGDKGGTYPKSGPRSLENGSVVELLSGRTMAGQEMEEGDGKRGQLGIGRTYGAVHLSEIATWPYPEMMDSSLIPAIPRERSSFTVRESTAQGRNNYWHTQWKLDVAGQNRFTAVFIPWCIEAQKYWRPVPDGWIPTDKTLQYVARVEQQLPRWLFGRSLKLTKEQVYWYECERAAAEARDEYEPGSLSYFLANYPAEPEESFQHSGASIFGPRLLDQLRAFSQPLVAAIEIAPAQELAQLRQLELQERSQHAS